MIDLKNIKEGDQLEGMLAVRSKDGPGEGLREYSNKEGRFFVLKAGNASGDITVKFWGARNPEKTTKLFSSFETGDVIKLKGRCNHDSYSKELVISVNEEVKYGSPPEFIAKAAAGGYNPRDFLPSLSAEKIESLYNDLAGLVSSVEKVYLKALLEAFFEDQKFQETFKLAPAARRHHHNYLGGLLEHSLNVSRLCETMAAQYPLDRDLLVTGALLHDIGKVREYSIKASVDITDEGRLIGHLPLGARMVEEKIEGIKGFPDTEKNKLIHMILAHHGELEYGSPKVPAFPEAMALFHADYMDAYVKNTIQEIEEGPDEEDWKYSRSMKRYLYKK